MPRRRITAWSLPAMIAGAVLAMAVAGCGVQTELQPGESLEISETTSLSSLTIAEDAVIKTPEGKSLTMTVDGIETGIVPGKYDGDIVLTVAEENVLNYGHGLVHHFRHALYLDETGLVETKSVLPAAGDFALDGNVLTGADITSVGENFNGIYVAGGSYTVKDPVLDFSGNGGNDFAGFGAAVMGTGKDTTLVVDGANINTHGVVRTAVIAGGGANVIVKNSVIHTRSGVLPADYIPNASTGEMKEVPWMLGLVGNCRATNVLGNNTVATYINSDVSAEDWGVLSTDDCEEVLLTAINSKISITGESGYGAYSIGDSIDAFYGCDISVPDYGVIITGGHTVFGASTPENIERLDTDLKLGLTPEERNALAGGGTKLTSGRFGIMWHGRGTAKIMDDAVLDCGKTVFLIKGAAVDIEVDGAKGVQLNSGNGIILQMMDNDDPGGVVVDGQMVNQGVYTEPEAPPVKADDFDVTAVNDGDVTVAFSSIALKGDFYNAMTGGGGRIRTPMPEGFMPDDMPEGGMPGGGMPGGGMPEGGRQGGGPGGRSNEPTASGKNMVLSFEKSQVTGVISAAAARHAKSTITGEDYLLLGEVTNTPCAAVNNGVIVSLADHSTWVVTDTSYLTRLTVSEDSKLLAPEGSVLSMTVDGMETPVNAGTYKGDVVLSVASP